MSLSTLIPTALLVVGSLLLGVSDLRGEKAKVVRNGEQRLWQKDSLTLRTIPG